MSASANVRNLLRNERKARRIEHPHATYNSSGVLACQLCHISIKAESLWNQHIHGSHHRGQLQRLKAAQASRAVAAANAAKSPSEQGASATAPNSKKRKADDDDDVDNHVEDARKKTRASVRVDAIAAAGNDQRDDGKPSSPLHQDGNTSEAVNEDEWAAFTREMASPPSNKPKALSAAANITAAPVSAEELAARSREEESRQAREARETEAEGEREDAAQRIVDELEEQEELQDRVQKLKEKRDALRRSDVLDTGSEDQVGKETKESAQGAELATEGSEESDEDSNDEWAMWPI